MLFRSVEEAKNKIAELMANTDTMKVRIADYEHRFKGLPWKNCRTGFLCFLVWPLPQRDAQYADNIQ